MTKHKTHEADWKVWGRKRGSQTFTAALPAKIGNPNDRVKLVAKSGVVTTGKLVEIHKSEDGLDFWTIERDAKTPEQQATDRALRLESQAEYWASDRGVETAQKIRDKAARKAQETAEESEESEESDAPTQTLSDEAATTLAKLLASGISLDVAAQTVNVMFPNAVITSQTDKPHNQNGTRQSRKTTAKTTAKVPDHGNCSACKRVDQPLTMHPAGHAVCNYCKSADVDTINRRVARKVSK